MKNKNNTCLPIFPNVSYGCDSEITVVPCSEYLDSRLPEINNVKSYFEDAVKSPIKIIDAYGDEMVMRKFEIKYSPYFLHAHKRKQS